MPKIDNLIETDTQHKLHSLIVQKFNHYDKLQQDHNYESYITIPIAQLPKHLTMYDLIYVAYDLNIGIEPEPQYIKIYYNKSFNGFIDDYHLPKYPKSHKLVQQYRRTKIITTTLLITYILLMFMCLLLSFTNPTAILHLYAPILIIVLITTAITKIISDMICNHERQTIIKQFQQIDIK